VQQQNSNSNLALAHLPRLFAARLHPEPCCALPQVIGGICLAIFEPLYKRSFAAGFSMIVIAIVLAYCTDSVMFARVAGEPAAASMRQQ
jgi:hypothetical protein